MSRFAWRTRSFRGVLALRFATTSRSSPGAPDSRHGSSQRVSCSEIPVPVCREFCGEWRQRPARRSAPKHWVGATSPQPFWSTRPASVVFCNLRAIFESAFFSIASPRCQWRRRHGSTWALDFLPVHLLNSELSRG